MYTVILEPGTESPKGKAREIASEQAREDFDLGGGHIHTFTKKVYNERAGEDPTYQVAVEVSRSP